MHTRVSILFQILFPFKLLHNIEQSSLCYTVSPCWLSILNIVVCTCQSQTANLSLPPETLSSFSKSVSLKQILIECLLCYTHGSILMVLRI